MRRSYSIQFLCSDPASLGNKQAESLAGGIIRSEPCALWTDLDDVSEVVTSQKWLQSQPTWSLWFAQICQKGLEKELTIGPMVLSPIRQP